MPFEQSLRRHYPNAVGLEAFATLGRENLAPCGIKPGNSLPIVGVCRDELLFGVTERLHAEWGPAFQMASLAGMVLLGRSGMLAAAHHAPDDAGRRRFVIFVLPHTGIAADGAVGSVQRDGQPVASAACGALVHIQGELASGHVDLTLDRHDLEMSLVRTELLQRLNYGVVPDLVMLTEVARQAAATEATRLAMELVHDPDCDVALLTGTVIHGPNGDWVAPGESWVSLAGTEPKPLTV